MNNAAVNMLMVYDSVKLDKPISFCWVCRHVNAEREKIFYISF